MVSESEIAAARTSCAPGLPLALPSALLISQHSSRYRSGMHRPAGRADKRVRTREISESRARALRAAMPSVWWLVAGAVVALYVRISRIRALAPLCARMADRVARTHRAPHGPPVGTYPSLWQFRGTSHCLRVSQCAQHEYNLKDAESPGALIADLTPTRHAAFY